METGKTLLVLLAVYVAVLQARSTTKESNKRSVDCTPNPCQNGGKFTFKMPNEKWCMHTQSEPIFSCTCPEGYSGIVCQFHVCDSHACQNGNCEADTSSSRGYKCSCNEGYTGENCEVEACKSGWIPFDGHCYLDVKTKTTWDNAKSECQKYDSKLVEIKTESKNSWIQEKFLPKKADCPHVFDCAVWIGATDRNVEGKYVWDSDNSPVTFLPWYPGEPNNLGDQDCASLLVSGQWDDLQCHGSLGFVCEMDQLNST